MLNIGENPTFDHKDWSVEVHIFDFSNEIYGDILHIEFVTKTRNEIRFVNSSELRTQLDKDEKEIRAILEI
jgi:riboflavin kinase/FMN adenylyltransferase